ncbi:MAG: thioredoxin domain-containing protein [Polyangiaceae bacterium]
MSVDNMWIHRFARGSVVGVLLIAATLVSCTAKPTGAPGAKDPTAESAPPAAQLATGSSYSGPQASAETLPISDDPVWGSPVAPVTLVEFSDLQCPFCARVEPTIKALRAKYGPSQLRLVFKHYPLPFHDKARPAAKVADAVFRQGGSEKFFAFLDLAFTEQVKLSDAAVSDWVARVGLSPALIAQRAALPDTDAKVDRDVALATNLGVNGTPAFRINGAELTGAQPLEAFTALIDAELVAAADLRKQGVPPDAIYKTRVLANHVAPKPAAPDEDEEDLTIWKMPIQGAPSYGAPDALVTIVEFFDYQCPYCRRVEATMTQLMAKYPKDLRIVLRQNPLPFHPHALPAANLALEARAEKGDAGFLEANRRLFEGELEEADLLKIAHDLKLNEQRVRAAIGNNTHSAEIEADADLASDFKASGTPYFFINGQRLSGAQPLESFVAVVDAQLKVARALVVNGTPRAKVYDAILAHAQDADPPEKKEIPAPTAENPTRGPLNAPVLIHEFADFQCPFCGRVEPTLAELEKAFPNQLRFVWHDLPLPFHANAKPAAIAAREVRAQKGDAAFWKLHDALFRDQGIDGALSAESLAKYAAEQKVDAARFTAAQSDGRYDALFARDQAIASNAGIHGTPAFVINGFYVSGAQSLSAFKRAVRRALTKKPVLVPVAAKATAKP